MWVELFSRFLFSQAQSEVDNADTIGRTNHSAETASMKCTSRLKAHHFLAPSRIDVSLFPVFFFLARQLLFFLPLHLPVNVRLTERLSDFARTRYSSRLAYAQTLREPSILFVGQHLRWMHSIPAEHRHFVTHALDFISQKPFTCHQQYFKSAPTGDLKS